MQRSKKPNKTSLVVGPDHILQIVNSRIAIYSKKGLKYNKTGTVLYGRVATKSVWTGFGGACEARNKATRSFVTINLRAGG